MLSERHAHWLGAKLFCAVQNCVCIHGRIPLEHLQVCGKVSLHMHRPVRTQSVQHFHSLHTTCERHRAVQGNDVTAC